MINRRADQPTDVPSFVDLLRSRALQQPEQRAYTFLLDGETTEAHLSYGEVDRQARAIAARLQSAGAAGERALLLYPPGLDYIAAFLGCLYAGVVAVPAYPPDPARLERTLPRLQMILRDARPQLVLTTAVIAGFAPALTAQDPAFAAVGWLATDTLAGDLAEAWRAPDLSRATLALLQYTSGSTAAPKGVLLTHGNLLHNSALIQRCFAHSPASRGVIWLPPYHDMGLIGGVLQPLYGGFSVVLMSPLAFLQRPLRWLEAIARYGATTSGGPNFAYDLCVRKSSPDQRAALDLSNWQVAFNGAEPIRPATLERFSAAFAGSGFRREAFYPCYGLAEATLIVAGGQAGDPPIMRAFQADALARNRVIETARAQGDDVRVLVGCGRSQPDQQIVIVDAEAGTRCAAGQVGEIWLAGPSVAPGYWERPAETAQTFSARLSDDQAGPFLRTGDLGFVLDDALFVTGRLKDLIIIRGRNLYPQDIELTIERSHPALRPGSGAAFAVEVAGEERLVVVQEVERGVRDLDVAAVVGAIRQAVAEQHEAQVYTIALIKAGSIPKTSSGKIQRHSCRARFLADELDLIERSVLDARALDASGADDRDATHLSRDALLASAPDAHQALLERYLLNLLARVLGIEPAHIDPQRPISTLGIDSLLAVELQHQIEIDLAAVVPMVHFLQDTTIGQLAGLLREQLVPEAHTRAPLDAARQAAPAPLAPVAQTGRLPLSFAQQHLWLLHQFAPENYTITIPVAVRLTGALDLAALQQSMNEIVRRHATLRTTFPIVDGQPQQAVAAHGTLPLPQLDLQAFAHAQREAQVFQLASAEAQRPFDLARGPLVRATMLRLGPQAHVLLLTMHHIVSDGWSMGIFVRELATLYAAYAAGHPSPLPELPIQYVDFALWQRQWLTAELRDAQLIYWRRQLGGALPVLELPLDRLRPAVQTFRGAWLELLLPRAIAAALKELSRQESVTLFMLLLAAFDLLLMRYSGQDDIVVGTPITGRNRVKTDALIGFFANVLVLRTDLSGDPSFRELLQRVRGVCLDAYAHQDMPFEQLIRELQPTRDLSRTPLFQVLLNMLNLPDRRIELPGLTIADLTPPDVGAKFDLTLYAQEQDDGLRLELVYNADLFERARMAALLDQFSHLLAQIVEQPSATIASYSLVTDVARMCLPDPAAPIPLRWDEALTTRFARQVRRYPDRLAVIDPYSAWSYADLDARSNQLAHYLCAQGIQPQAIIAVYAQRSAALVWALLGILKAGAAFMLLNPSYPPPQLIDRMRLTQPRGWLQLEAAGALPEALAEFLSTTPWCCRLELPASDDMPQPLADCATSDPLIAIEPEHLAYVTFTSGSTGMPKAILGEHRPLSHFLAWYERAFGLSAADHFSMLAGLTNDPLLRDIFTPLWLGATLHIPHPDDIGSARLISWMQPITVAHLTPAMVRLLLDSVPREQQNQAALPALRYAIVNGDVLTRRDVIRLRGLAPAATCLNVYGATEAPQITIYYQVAPGDDLAASEQADGLLKEALPIGRGIEDVQLLVFNAAEQLAGVSELGELYIRTPYLARGYMGNEALTQTRFRPNPFSNLAYDRIYRTGDLGRYLPDGNVEFAGRRDQQVKIRGFRVELDEIEGVLAQHPGILASAVGSWEAGGDRRLVAYVVMTNAERRTPNDAECDPSLVVGSSSFVTELRAFLATRLPDYMVPAAFMLLESLPLMPSGKLDRRALPLPDQIQHTPDDSFVAPRTLTEATLAQIWADVLEMDEVGVEDDFFALGGHSLLATQVVARMRDAFAVELPLRALFEASTVAGLAARIAQAQATPVAHATAPLRPLPRTGDLPLSSTQQRLWFLDQLQPGSPVYNIPRGVRMAGALDVHALVRSLNQIIARHEALRTTFATVDGEPIQVIATTLQLDLPIVDLRALPDAAREQAAWQILRAQAQRPFVLTRGPLIRALLLRLAADTHMLLLTLHHTVGDIWSLGVLVRELAALYSNATTGTPASLPILPIQYADYAIWQRTWLQSAAFPPHLNYWTAQLAGTAQLVLPTDRPRPPVQSFNGTRLLLLLPNSLTEPLAALGRRTQSTLFMVLLAAFQTLLHRYTGQHDIAVGSPIAGRSRVETERLIGYFANTLVLRAQLPAQPTFLALLDQVRMLALNAYAHQDVPFEQLVEALRPTRDLRYNPLFQVLFGLHNTPLPELVLPGLTLTLLEIYSPTARFDLALDLWEVHEGLRGSFEYNTDLFDATTILRMRGHFETLLASILAAPAQRLDALALLRPAERSQLLVEWPATQRPFPADQCIHQIFAEHAAYTPDAVAVILPAGPDDRYGTDQRLTYAELDARANQLARHLRRLGVGPEALAGICLERTLALPLAILGVLKAGSAYVPLDPDYPRERLRFMLEDSRAQVLITDSIYDLQFTIDDLEESDTTIVHRKSKIVHLRADWPLIARESPAALGDRQSEIVNPDNLAYVIYTSGSTGTPKGVMVSHRSVVNLQHHAYPSSLAPDTRDVWTLVHSYAFDFSVWELWGPLLHGGGLVLVPRAITQAPTAFYQLLVDQQVTVLNQTPSALRQLVAARQMIADQPALRLRWLICGGEGFPADLAGPVSDWQVPLWNYYGPTEATVWATAQPIMGAAAAVPIGRPLANMQVYVLDAALRPVPIGVAGELYIGGVGLARGYRQRPDLTAERFVPNPNCRLQIADCRLDDPTIGYRLSAIGYRLYRTGDLVRYQPDGTLVFLERIDQQVKLRGYRIELDEIAAVLHAHPAVRAAVVAARTDRPGETRLVAYVVPTDDEGRMTNDESADSSLILRPSSLSPELRAFLASHLPDYMLPAAFVFLDALPLSPNGKVDRRALPAPDGSRPELATSYVAPQSGMEQAIASVWQAVLLVEKVGANDNFFDLGGSSIHLVRVHSKLQQLFEREIPLVDMFKHPTTSALASYLGRERTLRAAPKRVNRDERMKEGKDRLKQLLKGARGD
jgi:amino acid adenylation domain-containing protein